MGQADPLFKDFVRKCLAWNPEDRITVKEALKHPWIKNEKSLKYTTEIGKKKMAKTEECFIMTLEELAKFADESVAVSDLEEKKKTITNVLASLNCSITAKAEEKILNDIVNADGTRIILQALCAEFAETDSDEELMIDVHKLLYKLAPFDQRFSLRVKLSQCIPITLSLLRIQVANIQSIVNHNSRYTSIRLPKISHSAPIISNANQQTPSRNESRRSSLNIPRLPTSLTNRINILLRAILCYCFRRGRSNTATLGRLGVLGLLCKVLMVVSGLSTTQTGVFPASDETVNNRMRVEKCTGNALKIMTNFSIIHQVLVTMTAIMKWRDNVIRVVGLGGVSLLLDLLLVLHPCDDDERLIDLQLLTIRALQTITELRAGRGALVGAGGLFSLFSLCANRVSAVKQSSSSPTTVISHHSDRQATDMAVSNHLIMQSSSSETLESLYQPWRSSATLMDNSSVSSGNFSRETTPLVHTMSSTSENLPSKKERIAKSMESVMNGICDLLRRCCPYVPLPVSPQEPILRVLFNRGKFDSEEQRMFSLFLLCQWVLCFIKCFKTSEFINNKENWLAY
ncbi:unnamed protein product [Rodentolepis nana]|uniref:Protein kinase domain-containing protein n=1 Tax=Rodentolepis nana TaxID=102285 RepID=A0A0R3T4J8_RODNA|nr:unnamed protein product [Rodentolepis nana]